jgi:hypothetical protein
MKKILVVMAAILAFCIGAFAQGEPAGDIGPLPGPNAMFYQAAAVGPVASVARGQVFFSAELPGNGKVITGAPYTATASTEMTQVLSDGNRIVNKTTASLARDSLGRTRREETMGMVGPWQVNGPKMAFINDPTSQTNYILDSNKQTAMVLKHAGLNTVHAPDVPVGGGMAASTAISDGPGGGEVGFKMVIQGRGPGGDQQDEAKTESLGTQVLEGVAVEGKRVTRRIPAGQIGNTQPIEITSEVWTSPDLQVIIMSKHSDPRFGETTYQLTDIQRVEPDHSLFEIPAGYAVKNMPAPMGIQAGTAEGEGPAFGVVTGGPIGK